MCVGRRPVVRLDLRRVRVVLESEGFDEPPADRAPVDIGISNVMGVEIADGTGKIMIQP